MKPLKGSMLAVISALLCFLGMLSTAAHAASYTTDFPKAEPLISEGGRWITAGTPGIHWHDTMCGFKGDQHISSVSTISGYAFGPTGPERFGDSLALLTGTWSPDQMAQATVRQVALRVIQRWKSACELRQRTRRATKSCGVLSGKTLRPTWRLLRGTAQQARHPIGPFSKSFMARIMELQPVTW